MPRLFSLRVLVFSGVLSTFAPPKNPRAYHTPAGRYPIWQLSRPLYRGTQPTRQQRNQQKYSGLRRYGPAYPRPGGGAIVENFAIRPVCGFVARSVAGGAPNPTQKRYRGCGANTQIAPPPPQGYTSGGIAPVLAWERGKGGAPPRGWRAPSCASRLPRPTPLARAWQAVARRRPPSIFVGGGNEARPVAAGGGPLRKTRPAPRPRSAFCALRAPTRQIMLNYTRRTLRYSRPPRRRTV